MSLREWIAGLRPRAAVPSAAPERADDPFAALLAHHRERGLEHELRADEAPLAVIGPVRSADAGSLRALGEALRAWVAAERDVTRVLGLERLLEGERPEVSALLLSIPFAAGDPESAVERVALAVVREGAEAAPLLAGLDELGARGGAATVWSWTEYSDMNR